MSEMRGRVKVNDSKKLRLYRSSNSFSNSDPICLILKFLLNPILQGNTSMKTSDFNDSGRSIDKVDSLL
jgi:hypothetical protein